MHEMSIAEGIVDIALDTLKKNNGTIVHSIQLNLGRMSGVEKEALLFCFDAVTKGTPAEGATLAITTLPIVGHCVDCDKEFPVENYRFVCPYCNSHMIATVSGRELQVTSIDMD